MKKEEKICSICKESLSSIPIINSKIQISNKKIIFLPDKNNDNIFTPCECQGNQSHKFCLLSKIIYNKHFKCEKCKNFYKISFFSKNSDKNKLCYYFLYCIKHFLLNIVILILFVLFLSIDIFKDKFIFCQNTISIVVFFLNLVYFYRNITTFDLSLISFPTKINIDNFDKKVFEQVDEIAEQFTYFLMNLFGINKSELLEIVLENVSKQSIKKESSHNKMIKYIKENKNEFIEENIIENNLLNIISIKTKKKHYDSKNEKNNNDSSFCVNIITSEPNEISDSPINHVLSEINKDNANNDNNILKIRNYQNQVFLNLKNNQNLCSQRQSPCNDKTPNFKTITESSLAGSNLENTNNPNGNNNVNNLLSSFRDIEFIKEKTVKEDEPRNDK